MAMRLTTEQTEQLQAILASKATQIESTVPRGSTLNSVVFLLCLEGSEKPNPSLTAMQQHIDTVVQMLQPAPSIVHVELLMPPDRDRNDMHFATYLGAKAGFGASFGGQRDFYLGFNASQWRAIPIVVHEAATRLRAEAFKHVDTPYSISKYLCAIPPFRALAGMLSETPGVSAHCAILAARVLSALDEVQLAHPPSWFGPSTLALEVDRASHRTPFHQRLADATPMCEPTEPTEPESHAMAVLMGGCDTEIRNLDFDECCVGLTRLTRRALSPELDDCARRIAQKQLATALLRFSVARNC